MGPMAGSGTADAGHWTKVYAYVKVDLRRPNVNNIGATCRPFAGLFASFPRTAGTLSTLEPPPAGPASLQGRMFLARYAK